MGLIIDQDLCTGCGACVDQCSYDALELVDDVAAVNDNCTLCRACLEVCPVEAISIQEPAGKSPSDAQDASGVWVYAEQRFGQMPEVVAELMGQGRRLADELGCELGAVVLGGGCCRELAGQLFALGADVVYAADHPELDNFREDLYCRVMADIIKQHRPAILLAGATAVGRSLIPRLATAVATGLTADCTGLSIDPENQLLLQTRPAFGGNIMATIVCPAARPQMATVRPRVMKKSPPQPDRQGRLVEIPLEITPQGTTRVLEVVRSLEESIDLTGAEVIVVGGRGLGGPEGFDLVRELADALGGVVGATRGAVDAGWIGHAHQVGQTGRTVAPKLYVALGVSGAVQHVVGMQGSDTVVAVNTDPNAKIFDVATYGIVGDLYQVVPAMLSRLRDLRG